MPAEDAGKENAMKKRIFLATLLVIGILAGIYSDAQSDKDRFGGGRKMFDVRDAETLSGEVVRISKSKPPMPNGPEMLVLILKTETETISVMLGPGSVLEEQGIQIKAKDRVEIRGVRAEFDGKPAIIATELKKGKITVKLQDKRMPPPRD